MFGLSELTALPPQSIQLVTRLGSAIGNAQGGNVAYGRIQAFRDMCLNCRWVFRRDSDGLYNCAGLVWASRRTGISRHKDWIQILQDDGYRRVQETSRLRLDNLVLYRDVDDNTYLHVAKIVRLESGIAEGSPPIPHVISKWGHDLGECFHHAYDHGMGVDYNVEIEFWTDRPSNEHVPTTTRSIIL